MTITIMRAGKSKKNGLHWNSLTGVDNEGVNDFPAEFTSTRIRSLDLDN